ncbi:MAG: DUF4363 family protein [Clostridia bacterium]|nr:DUF4363 family protein [Clostridia bacterium]
MKRVVAAVILIVLSTGVALWSGYVFEGRMDYFEAEMRSLLEAPESEFSERAENLVHVWKDYSGFLHAVFIHDGIDELERLILSLPLTAEHSDADEVRLKCVEGINLIENLKTCERLSAENIL